MVKTVDSILSEREEQYGDATLNFAKIGIIWGQLLDLPYSLDPYQVAQLYIAAKLVRVSANPELEDSWLDIQGYAALGLHSL